MASNMRSWKDGDRTWYEVSGPTAAGWQPNCSSTKPTRRVSRPSCAASTTTPRGLELARDFRSERHSIGHHGAQSRAEFALNLLMDRRSTSSRCSVRPEAARRCSARRGAHADLERNRFIEIIMTRVTVPLGEDIGFLPGTEEEKMERGWARS